MCKDTTTEEKYQKNLKNNLCCYLSGMRIDSTTYKDAAERIIALSGKNTGSFICIANAHVVLEASRDSYFKDIVNSADIVTPDGMPLVWSLRIFGAKNAQRVTGPDLTLNLCQKAQELGIPVGFYGGTPDTLDLLVVNLREKYPSLNIVYTFSPPFRPLTSQEDQKVIEDIKNSEVKILFVGLGCPKQERWAGEHLNTITAVMVTIGAAFNYIAGTKKQAPGWMQKIGCEWLFRFIHEPRRLWKRYLVGNSVFIYILAKEYFQTIFGRKIENQ